MEHRFNIINILEQLVGFRVRPIDAYLAKNRGQDGAELRYDVPTAPAMQEYLSQGSRLRAKDALGGWYYMPVTIRSELGVLELPYAVMSIKGKKIIQKTSLVERSGSVKELIAIDDYEISLAGIIRGENGLYPEQAMLAMRDLWRLNRSVELVSALSDLLLEPDDRIVIEDIEFPETKGFENYQAVKLRACTDKPFELIIP